jgi:hypothetical protein
MQLTTMELEQAWWGRKLALRQFFLGTTLALMLFGQLND